MKKLLCVIMVVAMIATLSTSVFATETSITSKTDSKNNDVLAKYHAGEAPDEYSVDLIWEALTFDYNATDKVWDDEEHTWIKDETDTGDNWVAVNNEITVVNHSSVSVNAGFSFKGDYDGLNGTFTNVETATELTSALVLQKPTAGEAAKEYKVSFMPSGDIPDTISATEYEKIGTITVTFG